MNQGYSYRHNNDGSSSFPRQSRMTALSSGSETATFRLPMIVPSTHQPSTVSDGSLPQRPPRGCIHQDTILPPTLHCDGHRHQRRTDWTSSYCTHSASLRTGSLNVPVLAYLISSLLIIFKSYYYFFKPSVKKYPRVEEKIKEIIVVAGMNINPGAKPC